MTRVQPTYTTRPSTVFRRTRLSSGLLAGLVGLAIAALPLGCSDDDDDENQRAGTGATGGKGGSGGGTGGDDTGGGSGGKSGSGGGGAGTGGASGGAAGSGGGAGDAGAAGASPMEGQAIFRDDTFGDEQLWTDTLQMHTVIGTMVTPAAALAVGLKVDATKVPMEVLASADLMSPATTVALIGLDAVVGVRGTVEDGQLTRVGITCALCHSTVDDSVMPGIGNVIDGAANRDLNPGAIIALSPALTDEQKAIYNSWGPGRYDPRFNIDGINNPILIPPIYGLQGVDLETYTGDGPISYWNAYVGITQMGGQGEFEDERIGVVRELMEGQEDLVNPKLPALLAYQLTLMPPEPEPGSFDAAAAERGEALFTGDAMCSTCHSGPSFSDSSLHDPAAVGQDPLYASRTATKQYRVTPLRALAVHPPYFHDGSAATLADVVAHYNTLMTLGLTAEQQADLVEYLKSL